MNNSVQRRQFLKGSLATAVAVGTGAKSVTAADEKKTAQEFYELRHYQIANAEKRTVVSNFLQKALVPALNRLGLDRVGVFTVKDNEKDSSIFVLIAYPTMEAFSQLNLKLATDSKFQKAAKDFFAIPKDDPAYQRVSSRFMKAFSSIPVIEMPSQTADNKPRMFELRIYESHNADAALRKVDMFDTGETQLMRDVEMAPVFFGETLIAEDVPNLTYMLSASNMDSHKEHWKAFLGHPEWDRMKKIPKYKGTVSKIRNWFLEPTEYSQI